MANLGMQPGAKMKAHSGDKELREGLTLDLECNEKMAR